METIAFPESSQREAPLCSSKPRRSSQVIDFDSLVASAAAYGSGFGAGRGTHDRPSPMEAAEKPLTATKGGEEEGSPPLMAIKYSLVSRESKEASPSPPLGRLPSLRRGVSCRKSRDQGRIPKLCVIDSTTGAVIKAPQGVPDECNELSQRRRMSNTIVAPPKHSDASRHAASERCASISSGMSHGISPFAGVFSACIGHRNMNDSDRPSPGEDRVNFMLLNSTAYSSTFQRRSAEHQDRMSTQQPAGSLGSRRRSLEDVRGLGDRTQSILAQESRACTSIHVKKPSRWSGSGLVEPTPHGQEGANQSQPSQPSRRSEEGQDGRGVRKLQYHGSFRRPGEFEGQEGRGGQQLLRHVPFRRSCEFEGQEGRGGRQLQQHVSFRRSGEFEGEDVGCARQPQASISSSRNGDFERKRPQDRAQSRPFEAPSELMQERSRTSFQTSSRVSLDSAVAQLHEAKSVAAHRRNSIQFSTWDAPNQEEVGVSPALVASGPNSLLFFQQGLGMTGLLVLLAILLMFVAEILG